MIAVKASHGSDNFSISAGSPIRQKVEWNGQSVFPGLFLRFCDSVACGFPSESWLRVESELCPIYVRLVKPFGSAGDTPVTG